MKRQYNSVSIPKDLLTLVRIFVKKDENGFRNPSEFIIDGIREKLRKHGVTSV